MNTAHIQKNIFCYQFGGKNGQSLMTHVLDGVAYQIDTPRRKMPANQPLWTLWGPMIPKQLEH